MQKLKFILFSFIIGLNLIGCSTLSNNNESLNEKKYDRYTEQYNYNWKIGFQTINPQDQLGTLLVYENEQAPLNFNIGFSGAGDENDITETEIRIYYDYKPISFKLEDSTSSNNFEYKHNLDIKNHTEYNLELYLNPNEIIKDNNIHKIFVTATTGNHVKSKDLNISTSAYGASSICDLVHTDAYTNSFNNLPEYTTFNFSKITDIVLSPNVLSLNQDKTFNPKNVDEGIYISEPNYISNNNSIIFNAFVSPTKNNEDMLVMFCLNFEPYLLGYIPKTESVGTYFSEIELALPAEISDYEFTAYTITNPFEKILDVSHQFTKIVDRFTITTEN